MLVCQGACVCIRVCVHALRIVSTDTTDFALYKHLIYHYYWKLSSLQEVA